MRYVVTLTRVFGRTPKWYASVWETSEPKESGPHVMSDLLDSSASTVFDTPTFPTEAEASAAADAWMKDNPPGE